MKTLEEELRYVLGQFCRMKREMCIREGGPYDLAPMLHFKYRHLNAYCGVMIMGNPFEMVPSAWRKILDDGMPEFMMLMVEGYASEKNQGYKKGQMERDFKENPDSDVREIITVQAVDIKTGKQMTGLVSYKYGDDGLPEFGEMSVGPCEGQALECNVPDMFRACRNATLGFFEQVA